MLDLLSNMRLGWCAMRLDEPGVLALDDLDALSFLRQQGVSGRFIQWFWASAMLALLNVPLKRCSAASMMRVFRLLLGRSGYCFGFPKTGLAELYVPGCRRLIENHGGAVLTSTAVRAVLLGDDGSFEGFALEDGRELRARAGVFGLQPQGLAARLEPSRYVSTMLWFDRKLTRERFWSRVLAAGDLNTDFYDLSNIRGAGADAPSLIAANAIHASEAWTWSDAEVIARTCDELSEFVGPVATAEVRHARVHRIPMAVPCPVPGFERARPMPESGVPGLWLPGDWTATFHARWRALRGQAPWRPKLLQLRRGVSCTLRCVLPRRKACPACLGDADADPGRASARHPPPTTVRGLSALDQVRRT